MAEGQKCNEGLTRGVVSAGYRQESDRSSRIPGRLRGGADHRGWRGRTPRKIGQAVPWTKHRGSSRVIAQHTRLHYQNHATTVRGDWPLESETTITGGKLIASTKRYQATERIPSRLAAARPCLIRTRKIRACV